MVKKEKLGQNSLTPKLDSTMDMMEMSPHELSELYTNTHVVWNGLLSGKIYDDWTFDKVKSLHKKVLTRMKEENITYEPISDGLDTAANMAKGVQDEEIKQLEEKELPIIDDNKKLPIDILAEFYKTNQQIVALFKKESMAGEIPNTEEKKDIAKLPKDIKSNIKDLLEKVLSLVVLNAKHYG